MSTWREVADDATRRELAFLSEGRSFDGEPCPEAKIDEKRIKALCATMYRIARKNCNTEEERRTVKRITPQQLEAWGVIAKVHGKWMGSNTYALLTGDPAFAIRLKCGLFKGNDKAVFLDRREWGSGLRRVNRVLAEYGIRPVAIDEAAFATQMNVYRITAPGHAGNEGNREGNHDPNEPNRAPNGTNVGTNGTNVGTNGTNQIVECLRETPSISLDELAKRIGVSRRTVVRMVDRLKKQGRIRRKGGTRGVWEVL